MVPLLKWDKKRWSYFKESEFMCKCGCTVNGMDEKTLDLLQELRIRCGFALMVSSGYRCPKHNDAISSTGLTGPHTTGKAADLRVDRNKAYHLLKHAMTMGFSGIGVAQKGAVRFIHVDTIDDGLTRPTVWSY